MYADVVQLDSFTSKVLFSSLAESSFPSPCHVLSRLVLIMKPLRLLLALQRLNLLLESRQILAHAFDGLLEDL